MKQMIRTALVLCPLLMTVTNPTVIWASETVNTVETQTVESRLREMDKAVFRPPVNARVDRVWHAIPGLCGWALDYEKSLQRTKQANDAKLHVVLKEIPPNTRLSELPPEPIYRGPSTEKSVCLMVNVSWGEEYIPSILDTLRDNHVHATFFLDGAWVKRHANLARQIVTDGQAIGSHGSGHPDFRKLSSWQLEQQIQNTNESIESALGKTPRLLAPPAGSYDGRTLRLARAHGMYTILWTADTVDWRRPPASTIISRAVNGSEPGALILMHPTDPTARALPQLIKNIAGRGYHFKTVEEVVDEKPIGIGHEVGLFRTYTEKQLAYAERLSSRP